MDWALNEQTCRRFNRCRFDLIHQVYALARSSRAGPGLSVAVSSRWGTELVSDGANCLYEMGNIIECCEFFGRSLPSYTHSDVNAIDPKRRGAVFLYLRCTSAGPTFEKDRRIRREGGRDPIGYPSGAPIRSFFWGDGSRHTLIIIYAGWIEFFRHPRGAGCHQFFTWECGGGVQPSSVR